MLKQAENKEEKNLAMETHEEKIVRLLEENLEVSKQILTHSKKTRHWILIQKIKGWFYVVLIIVPLILAFFYLPPLLDGALKQYQDVWKMITGVNQQDISVELDQKQLEQLKFFCEQQK